MASKAFFSSLLSDRRQRSELCKRLTGRGGGYDFHRSLKRICSQYSSGLINLSQALDLAETISRLPERRSARSGLEAYVRWRSGTIDHQSFPQSIYESPARRFKVTFTPDFAHRVGGRLTAAHIWNTASPPLNFRMCYLALHFAADGYVDVVQPPQDLAVLDLRSQYLVRLSEATLTLETAHAFASRLDELISDVEQEIDETGRRPDPRPTIAR